MTDFLLELLSEEIPARMQERASADLARLFEAEIARAGLKAKRIESYATPRRLALIARGLPLATEAVSEEIKGPRASAPPQALEGFLRKTGLTRDQLVERDGILFAVIDKPGRPAAQVLAEAIPAIIRAFPWPKSMRWGQSSRETTSLRWVRPLQGIVALLGDDVVDCEIDGVRSGSATVGHRFHHPGIITIGNADDYAAKLRACHVIVDPAERRAMIAEGAAKLASDAGLSVIPDEGLLAENAGLTEWPVPLLGSFDPAFLEVPREVIQLTMRTNQKYFALVDGQGNLAPNFICTANLTAADGGEAIVAGNRKVLAARLSDAKFFWEQDLKVPLEEQAKKLEGIVFHEKLGTVADKVERVAKLARWLVEEGIIKPSPPSGGEGKTRAAGQGEGGDVVVAADARPTPDSPLSPTLSPASGGEGASLADLTEQAARLAKADLVTGMVGEFPELQGVMGGYYARAQGYPAEVADAIRDHYKPVGQGDEVPTAPVTVAVSLADKLDTLVGFFAVKEKPTGSKDPFALRRAAMGDIALALYHTLRFSLDAIVRETLDFYRDVLTARLQENQRRHSTLGIVKSVVETNDTSAGDPEAKALVAGHELMAEIEREGRAIARLLLPFTDEKNDVRTQSDLLDFFADRLKVQQREAGVRHDLIDAVFALGGEDDLVRLLARVKALQSFVGTEDGEHLLTGYRRAANIVRIEAKKDGENPSPPSGGEGGAAPAAEGEGGDVVVAADARPTPDSPLSPALSPASGGEGVLSYTPEKEEAALIAALDAVEPRAAAAVEAEDFEGAMAALAALRKPIDDFFDKVTVNDPDPAKRRARLALLDRIRAAVHRVADFSKIEG